MQKLLCFLFLMGCFYQNIQSQARAKPGEEWQLTEEQKNGMLARLTDCGLFDRCNDNSRILDPENDVYQWIVAKYPDAKITLVDARYRTVDQDRYRRLRNIQETDKYQVRGFKTQLVKVELTAANQTGSLSGIPAAVTIYYDCFTICPPPHDGGCGSPTGS